MPETGSPLEDEKTELRSVSPPSTHHASRSSTPGISSLDGTPRYLFAFSNPPPPSPRATSPPPDMAVKATPLSGNGHKECHSKLKPTDSQGQVALVAPDELADEDSSQDEVTTEDDLPTLPELSHLLRLEKYQSRKCSQAKIRLHHLHSITAQTTRLIHTARLAKRTLAECIRSEDKHSFVNLFNSFRDAVSESTSQASVLVDGDQALDGGSGGYPHSFLDALPNELRVTVLDFLTKTRHDGNYLADRIAALTHGELVALLPGKGLSKSSESVLGSSPRTSSRTSRHLGFTVDGLTDLFSSSDFASPLDTIIHSVRGMTGCSLQNDSIATDVWATVCARLISDQKPGSEKLVPAVIDAWASSSSWSGKHRLGLWISETLQNGAFLLEQPSRQSFRMRMQGRPEPQAEDEARTEAFYTGAVNSLLKILGDSNGASVIPPGALEICKAIFSKLQYSPGHQQAFPSFAVTRWLFSTFLIDAIVLPEFHDLLTDHYIPDHARHRILREIASRCQKIVFDVTYAWKHGSAASLESTQLVRALTGRLQGPKAFHQPASRSEDPLFVAVSAMDVITLVNSLYPQRRNVSMSDHDSGLQSSASSISGFSLFQNLGVQDPPYGSTVHWNPNASQVNGFDDRWSDGTSQENLVKEDALLLDSRLENEQLREACSVIEDIVANQQLAKQSQWSILVELGGTNPLRSVHESFLEISDGHVMASPSRTHENTNDNKSCKAAIEDLLQESEYQDGDPPHFAARCFGAQISQIAKWIIYSTEQRIRNFEESLDFVAAHSWYRKLCKLRALLANETSPGALFGILDTLRCAKEQSLNQSAAETDACDAWLRVMKASSQIYSQELSDITDMTRRLRDKMSYVADVRTSAAYEEARAIVSALKVMGKPKKPARTRLAPPLRRWSQPKLSNTSMHLKTESQVLELLSAPPDHGGPNKLSDDQSKILSAWLERNGVENFCRGEERLHRLCMEIRKAVEQLTADGSTFWSSALFSTEKLQVAPQSSATAENPFWTLHDNKSRFNLLPLRTGVPPSTDAMSSASSHPLSARSSRDYLDTRSPTLTNRSSVTFWSPAITEARSPSSATSVGLSQSQAAPISAAFNKPSNEQSNRGSLIDQVRQRTTSLFLSDLASPLFNNGSETDHAFWSGLGGQLTLKHLRNLFPEILTEQSESLESTNFNFEGAFGTLVHQFSASSNPYVKLAKLLDMDTLLAPFMAVQSAAVDTRGTGLQLRTDLAQEVRPSARSKTVDVKVDGFRRIFCNSNLRPASIFRDLQYIAIFVPSNTLENTAQGKAFWNAAVAISGLKQEARNIMVETADSIIAFQSNNRGHERRTSVAQQERDSAAFSVPSRTPSAEDIAHYTIGDAAHLLQIAAKEGDAAAQRELATLYLTHPEQLDHIIAPFSRPRDVFKEELESKWRKNQDPTRCDPVTMCVAHHWMSLSSKGGDALATEFLRQREEMERLP